MPTASSARRSPRCGSSANSLRRCNGAIAFWCACSAAQAERCCGVGMSELIDDLLLCLKPGLTGDNWRRGNFVRPWRPVFPYSEATQKRIVVVTKAATGRDLLQQFCITPAQNDFVGLECGDQLLD